MKSMRLHPTAGILLFLWLLSFLGCAWQQPVGTLALEPKYSEDQTLERLQRDWEAYHIYYIGRFQGSPRAMVFDPREDDRALRQEGWTRAEDVETVQEVVGWIRNTQFHPRLHQILGPEEEFYGYLYTAWDNHVLVRQTDQHTAEVIVQEVPIFF